MAWGGWQCYQHNELTFRFSKGMLSVLGIVCVPPESRAAARPWAGVKRWGFGVMRLDEDMLLHTVPLHQEDRDSAVHTPRRPSSPERTHPRWPPPLRLLPPELSRQVSCLC